MRRRPEWAVPEDDHDWFQANPRRAHRVREYVVGEFRPTDNPPRKRGGWRLGVVVRQVRPGVRIRVAFWVVEDWDLRNVPEHVASALFDWTYKAFRTGEPADVSELFAQIHQQGSDAIH